MAKFKSRKSPYGRDPNLSIVIGAIIGCVVLATGLAVLWQNSTTTDNIEPYSPSEARETASQTPAPTPSQESTPTPTPTATPEPTPTPPLWADRVTSEYFTDAVFIGDSLTQGILLYNVLPEADVYADKGINLYSVHTKEFIPSDAGNITLSTALSQSDHNKIYIMMGANGLDSLGAEETAKLYSGLVDSVKALKPEAIIYIQSTMPINEEKFAAIYNKPTTNEMIDQLNVLLEEMAKEKGAVYLDVASKFKDETGALPADQTDDGLHLRSSGYIQWMDYLKEHTIPVDTPTSVGTIGTNPTEEVDETTQTTTELNPTPSPEPSPVQ